MTQRRTATADRPDATARVLAGVIVAALLATAAHAVPDTTRASRDDDDAEIAAALKRAYLACDRASAAGPMDSGEIWRCSVIYETLKRRVFDGDFERLRAWSRRQPGQ